MDYCSYHPTAPATYACGQCHALTCDHCSDEGDRGGEPFCFTCGQALDPLGGGNSALPFWRRLEESFRYPLKGGAAGLVLVVSLLMSTVIYLPLGLLWYLLVLGSFMKYCFSCLEHTARGKLLPPDISEGYGGGLSLLLNLLVMFVVAGLAIFATNLYLGTQMAALLTFFVVIAMPAVVIIYGMTESLLESLNPLNLLRLISGIGLPYGLLLGFLMIMSASVGVISELIGYDYAFVSTVLQSAVSNYYSVVMFHIMGYMIFQYQGVLGFTAREDDGEQRAPRTARDRHAAKLQICLKQGDYNQVVSLFKTALKKFPRDREFNRQYFEFLYATGRDLDNAGSRYLDYLLASGQEHQLGIVYKRMLHALPDFRPNSAATRHHLAIACKRNGDPRSAARLVNGMHREFPEYPSLASAYELMAEALDDIPHQQEQAAKCRQLVAQLARRAKAREAAAQGDKAAPPAKRRANFAVEAVTSDSSDEKAEQSTAESTSGARELPPIEFK